MVDTHIIIEDRDRSVTNSRTVEIKLRPKAEPWEVFHEIGHAIALIKGLYDKPEFLQLLADGLSKNISEQDLVRGETRLGNDVWHLWTEDGKFVDPYQAVTRDFDHDGQPRFDAEGRFNIKTLREYFSSGFEKFYTQPELLLKKDPKLFQFIKELSDGFRDTRAVIKNANDYRAKKSGP